jgi:hypothetical protein
LPFTAGEQKDVIIGLVGAKYSAKSHYVATLVDQLKNRVGREFGIAPMAVDDATIETYERFYHIPLIKDHLEIKETQADPTSAPRLIYCLKLDGALWGKPKQSRSVTLVLCDTAGENFDIGKDLAQTTPYLKAISGLIFLIDPLQWEAVRQQVGDGVKIPKEHEDPSNILNKVGVEFAKKGLLAPDKKIKIPVAIALAKFDGVEELINQDSFWHGNTASYEAIHKELAGYVDRWGREGFTNVLKAYFEEGNYAFFAVSPTGCSSDKQGRFPFVSPKRVEEPLLWLLHKLDIIPGA